MCTEDETMQEKAVAMAATMPPKALITLDLCGLNCPAPLLGAKRVVDDLQAGQTMLLVSDCPGTADDLFAWARYTGNQVSATTKLEGDKTGYYITKGRSARPVANVVLDMLGVSCPGPIVEAKKLLDGMRPEEVLLMISNCPGAPGDVDAWLRAKTTAIELVAKHERRRGEWGFYLRRK
jgi:tRNA 2-thiouridine synthesizing protein A